MKKNNLFIVAIVALTTNSSLNAQTPWYLGGNNVATTENIGTTSNYDWPIITNNSENSRFIKTGEFGIGIGTTTPGSFLNVYTSGSTRNAEPFRTVVPSSTETNWRMYKGSNQVMRITSPSSGDGLFIQSPRGDMKIASGNSGTAIPAMAILGGSGSDAGNVLIGDYTGAYSPTAKLHVKGGGYSSLLKIMSSALTTPALEVLETEQQFFKVRNDVSSSGSAFNFDYQPSTTLASGGIGSTISTDANCTYDLVCSHFSSYNSSTSATANTRGITVTSNSDGIGSYNEGITVSCISPVGANLSGIFVANNVSPGDYNIGVFGDGSYSENNNYGVFGRAFGDDQTGSIQAIGVYGEAIAAPLTIGVYGISTEATTDASDYIGVKGEAVNDPGISSTSAYYGVYGSAPSQTCSNTSCAGAAGYFNGDVYASAGLYNSSDLKLKDQIVPLSNASSILAQLNPKQYVYKTNTFPGINLADGQHFGMIAQDVEAVLPNLVKEFKNPKTLDSLGNQIYASFDAKAVNYIELIPLLVAGFNEQKLIIDSLINALQNPTPIINPSNNHKIQLSNATGFILNQNDPNPFTESTIITYNIPEEVNSAKIIFTNSTGVIINTIVIGEKGSGQLEVYASDLSKGIYVYSLVCDGKVVSSKKMIKQ